MQLLELRRLSLTLALSAGHCACWVCVSLSFAICEMDLKLTLLQDFGFTRVQ